MVPEKYTLTTEVKDASASNGEETVSALDKQGVITIPIQVIISKRFLISFYLIVDNLF